MTRELKMFLGNSGFVSSNNRVYETINARIKYHNKHNAGRFMDK